MQIYKSYVKCILIFKNNIYKNEQQLIFNFVIYIYLFILK